MRLLRGLVLALLVLSASDSGAQLSTSAPATTPSKATLAVTALSAANTAVTATLPAVVGQFHYIVSLQVTRTCTTAITGSAVLAITTTNLPGTPAWTAGNACLIGSTNKDVDISFSLPIKSSAVNTASTVVCPAIGAAGLCRITVTYYTNP